ncbi:MAG: metallophosphoesterase [Acidobacteriota bacterium]
MPMRSSLVIAHISDLHYPLWEDDAWQDLRTYISSKKPDLIVATGDLTDHPWSRKGTRDKLLELVRDCQRVRNNSESPAGKVVLSVVPGNHDYRISGILPSAFGRRLFARVFSEHFGRFLELEAGDCLVYLFSFDSNHLMAGWAKGRVSARQLKGFARTINNLRTDGEKYKRAYKIAVLHHHPLPILHAGLLESFLVLINAGEFLRHMAQAGVDLILHGHRHRRVVSFLNLGSTSGLRRKLSVVASGTTLMRGGGGRGNSCNVITVHGDHLAVVTEALRTGGAAFAEADPVFLPPWEEYVVDRYQDLVRSRGYRIEAISKSIVIDEQGYARVELKLDRVVVADRMVFKGVEPLEVEVERGRIEHLELTGSPHAPSFPVRGGSRHKTIEIPPSELLRGSPLSLAVSYWHFNSWALDTEQFRRKYPQRKEAREESCFECIRPVRVFHQIIGLPRNCKLGEPPELIVYRMINDGKKPFPEEDRHLTEHFSSSLQFFERENTISLTLNHPLPGFRYAVRWWLPKPYARQVSHVYSAEQERMIQELRKEASHRRLNELMRRIERAAKDQLGIGDAEEIDVSFSIPVYEPDKPAAMKFIASNDANLAILSLELEVGDGAAGAAYEENRIVSFVRRTIDPRDPKNNIYVEFGTYQHQALYAVPVRHPLDRELVIGVLSVGSQQVNSKLIPDSKEKREMIGNTIQGIACELMIGALCALYPGILTVHPPTGAIPASASQPA